MVHTTQPVSAPCHQAQFRRQWYRTAIPSAFAFATFGLFAYHIPNGIWVAVPALCMTLLFCSLLHGGLIISHEGIAWYILHPKWRYRSIPWPAVLEVRRTLFGIFHPIHLTVEHGRYEVWIWTPQRDRQMCIMIRTNGYSSGNEIWDVLRDFRTSWARADEVALVNK